MQGIDTEKKSLKGGFLCRATAAALLALVVGAAQLPGVCPASDWQLVPEKESPLPEAQPPQAVQETSREIDILAPQNTVNPNLQKETDRLRRYLKRYRELVDKFTKQLETIGQGGAELSKADRDRIGVYRAFQDDLVKLIAEPMQRLKEYKELIKTDPRFANKDPGQVPALRSRGDELIKNARKMCALAEKWAKSKDAKERKRLGDEFEALRRETVDKQNKLMKTYNEMFDLLRPIFKALSDDEKEINTKTKGELRTKYAKLLSFILDNTGLLGKLEKELSDIKQIRFPAAESAAQEVSRILGNNATLPGISDKERQEIIKEIDVSTGTLEAVKKKRRQLWGTLGRHQHYKEQYGKIKESVGIDAARAALRSGNVNTLPGSCGDDISKLYNGVFKLFKDIGKVKSQIEERDALIDQEWRRSRDELRKLRAECIDKWRKKKPVRVFKGSMNQEFSGRVVGGRNKKCASLEATCTTRKFSPVTLTVNPNTGKAFLRGKKIPFLFIFHGPTKGIRCKKNETRTWIMNYILDYDAAKNSLSAKWKTGTMEGRIQGKLAQVKVIGDYTKKTPCGSTRFIWNLDIELSEADAAQGEDLVVPLQLNTLGSSILPLEMDSAR